MKYQHYNKYVVAAEALLPNLPEVFTAKEFDAVRTPMRVTIKNKIENEIRPKFWNTRPENTYWGEGRKIYNEWISALQHEIFEAEELIPVSLQTLRAHNFVITDHQEPVTIIVDDPWSYSAPVFYYDEEEVSEKIYNKMKKYEPEKCRKVDGREVDAWRNYYRVDWDALNEYLAGDASERSRELLEEIKKKEQEIAELRERRKQECPHWND